MIRLLALGFVAVSLAQAGGAQGIPGRDPGLSSPLGPIVGMVDFRGLFGASRFGVRATEERVSVSRVLGNENAFYSAALTEREAELASIKASADVAEFEKLAEEFHRQAEARRDSQDSKKARIDEWYRSQREMFEAEAREMLPQVAEMSGVDLIVDLDGILWSTELAEISPFEAVDLTGALLAELDRSLGDGTTSDRYRGAAEFSGIELIN